MSDKSVLVGFVRKSNKGGALKLNLDKEALNNATTYTSGKDGKEYITLVINASKAQEILSGTREVISVNQMIDQGVPEADE